MTNRPWLQHEEGFWGRLVKTIPSKNSRLDMPDQYVVQSTSGKQKTDHWYHWFPYQGEVKMFEQGDRVAFRLDSKFVGTVVIAMPNQGRYQVKFDCLPHTRWCDVNEIVRQPSAKEDKVDDRCWVVWNPRHGSPTVRHPNRAEAEAEAERLSRRQPAHTFYVLQEVSRVTSQQEVRTQWE